MEDRTMLARRSVWGAATMLLAALAAPVPASAYTDEEIIEIFQGLDAAHDGKVTRNEFNVNKVMMIYRNVPTGTTDLTFEQTMVSREFFDAADANHDGKLSPTEIMDALPFEAIDLDHKGYFDLDDLRRFLNRISGP
jgi:Ca2+-binding EF-hand superfamily protein